MLLAIETSCDETAVAVLDDKAFLAGERALSSVLKHEIVSSQVQLHSPYGGVVPELASREHIINLPMLVQEALRAAGTSVRDLSAVCVTRGPGLNGCLLVGVAYAKALASALRIPLFPLNHLEGHIFAGELREQITALRLPALVLLVSGGHTELLFVPSFRKYEVVARTRDDAAGEAFDKCASLLGLPYPGGPALSALAQDGDATRFSFPVGMPDSEHDFSFSGVKTAVSRVVRGLGDLTDGTRRDLAASVEQALVAALVHKTERALRRLRPVSFLLTGGVAANQPLRTALGELMGKRNLPIIVPDRRWCTDNAAMMGMLGLRIIEHLGPELHGWKPGTQEHSDLAPGVPFGIGAVPRWPLEEVSFRPAVA